MKHKNAFVFVTYKTDVYTQKYVEYLHKSCEDLMDFWILLDINKGDNNVFNNYNVIKFNHSDFEFWMFKNRTTNLIYPHELFFNINKNYEHYLFFENDIVIKGNMKCFLNNISNVNSDFIHISTDILKGNHWVNDYNKFNNKYWCWCQMTYISNKLMDKITQHQNKYDIYYENLYISIAHENNMIIRQFENFGFHFFVDWGSARDLPQLLNIPEFSYMLDYTELYNTLPIDNCFFHPIKDLSIIDYNHKTI